jgi:hypothetical protein
VGLLDEMSEWMVCRFLLEVLGTCWRSVSSLTVDWMDWMDWTGLDWIEFGCVMRCEAMRNDMTRTRHEALVSTWFIEMMR